MRSWSVSRGRAVSSLGIRVSRELDGSGWLSGTRSAGRGWPGRDRELGHVSAEPKVLYPAEGQGTGIGRAGSGSGEPHALTRNGGGEYNL